MTLSVHRVQVLAAALCPHIKVAIGALELAVSPTCASLRSRTASAGADPTSAIRYSGTTFRAVVAPGVEILECTYDVASILAKMLEQEVLPSCRPGEDVRVAVFHDSIFNRADCISRADICFANCVTWPNDTMVQLSALAEGESPGRLIRLFIT